MVKLWDSHTAPRPAELVKGAARRPTITDKVAKEAVALLSRADMDTAELATLRRYLGNLVAYQAARSERKAAEL